MTDFFDIFNWVIEHKELNTKEKMYLLTLLRFRNKETGLAFPSNETLKKCINIKNNKSFHDVKKSLLDKDLIKIIPTSGGTNHYKLTIPNVTGSELQNVIGSELQNVTINKKDNNQIEQSITMSNREQFYASYKMSEPINDKYYYNWMEMSSEFIC